jgi:hypothetical protein
VFIFSRSAPNYTPRLDLQRIVRRTIDTHATDFWLRALRRQLAPAPPSET